MDPFSATPMMILICDIVEPSTGELYARDPRSTAKRAAAYLKASGIGDTAYVGPEAEFFVFDAVKFGLSYNGCFYSLAVVALPVKRRRHYNGGNMAPCPPAKRGYFLGTPVERLDHLPVLMVSP